jgi:hypothetical protein
MGIGIGRPLRRGRIPSVCNLAWINPAPNEIGRQLRQAGRCRAWFQGGAQYSTRPLPHAPWRMSRYDVDPVSYSSSGSVFLLCRLTSPGLIPGPTNSFPVTSATASASSPSFTGTLLRTNSMALSLTGSYARKFRTIRGFPSESKVVTRMFHPAGIVSPNCYPARHCYAKLELAGGSRSLEDLQ